MAAAVETGISFEDKLVVVKSGVRLLANRKLTGLEEVDFISFFQPDFDLGTLERDGYKLNLLKIAYAQLYLAYSKQEEKGEDILVVKQLSTPGEAVFPLPATAVELFPLSKEEVLLILERGNHYIWRTDLKEQIFFTPLGREGRLLAQDFLAPALNGNKLALYYADGTLAIFEKELNPEQELRSYFIGAKQVRACLAQGKSTFLLVTEDRFYSAEAESQLLKRSRRLPDTICEALAYNDKYLILVLWNEVSLYRVCLYYPEQLEEVRVLLRGKERPVLAGMTASQDVAILESERYLTIIDPLSSIVLHRFDPTANF